MLAPLPNHSLSWRRAGLKWILGAGTVCAVIWLSWIGLTFTRGPRTSRGLSTQVFDVQLRCADIRAPVTLRIDKVDADGTETILERTAQPNENVYAAARGRGETSFLIYYDGHLVKRQRSSD